MPSTTNEQNFGRTSLNAIPRHLIDRYSTAIPRYTSYPTAPNFSADYKQNSYQQSARDSNQVLLPRDLSVYVHVPFCHSLCYFCGCNKVITRQSNAKVDRYVDHLIQEMALRSKYFDSDRRVTQIHFGGGTPNFLREAQLAELLEHISVQFHLDLPSRLEVGIEIDPRSIDARGVKQLANAGFNRFSIGVQDFSPEVQQAVNRIQDEKATLAVIDAALQVSSSVNVDLICGLPKQDVESFSQTLDKIVDAGVSRIAAYNFAYLPERIKAQRMIDPSDLPTQQVRLDLTEITRQKLLSAGYQHIGMDHFALPNDSLSKAQNEDSLQRNFQGYTTHAATDLIGLGASAISQFKNAFAQNATSLSDYMSAIDANKIPVDRGVLLDDDDVLRADLIQHIMCRNVINLDRPIRNIVDNNSEQTIADYFADEIDRLAQFEKDELIKRSPKQLQVTELGSYFRRQLAACFDEYLPDKLKISCTSQPGYKDSKLNNKASRNVVKFSQAL